MARSGHDAKAGQLAIAVGIGDLGEVRSFFQRWVVTTGGVLVASHIIPGITYQTVPALLAASLLLGIFNAVLRPIMLILSLPLLLVTLGLFTFVINAILLLLVGKLITGFDVSGFGAAFIGGVVISIISFIANGLIGKPEKRPAASEPPQSPRKPPPGSGPIIDV